MRLKNISDQGHVYTEPAGAKTRYQWGPGETKTCPDGIARLILRNHPSKFSVEE